MTNKIKITHEEALRRVRGYLTDLLPIEDYDEVEEIMSALEQLPKIELTNSNISKEELKSMVKRAIYDSISAKDNEEMSPYEKKLLTVNKIIQKLIDDHCKDTVISKIKKEK